MKENLLHIGTSGWHYKHWSGSFYPPTMHPKDFLHHYQQLFHTVEINNSFYKLPSAEVFRNWRLSVPDDFVFAVKASRYITHMKKLLDPQTTFSNFIGNVEALKEKLGPILFQLPPGWNFNEERFEAFLRALPKHLRYTFEFRNATWYNPIVYDLLRKYNAAFCIYELEWHKSPMEVTADFVYVRLHGPEGKYAGSYSEDTLVWWADMCRIWQGSGKKVYIYFDNDQNGFAAFNAKQLAQLVKDRYGDASVSA